MRYTMGSNVVKSGKKKKWGKYEKIVFYDVFFSVTYSCNDFCGK